MSHSPTFPLSAQERERSVKEQADQLEEAARKFSALEGSLQDQTVRERIQEVEKTQNIAELKQTIANLEFQNQQVSPQQCRLAVNQTASASAACAEL